MLFGIALVIGVDRILDMARTTVNVAGDAAVSVVVQRVVGGSIDGAPEPTPPTPR